MTIPTFKIKFKHKFGACIKKVLKTFPIIKFYFTRIYVLIYVTYQQNFRPLTRDLQHEGCYLFLLKEIESVTKSLFWRVDLLFLK